MRVTVPQLISFDQEKNSSLTTDLKTVNQASQATL